MRVPVTRVLSAALMPLMVCACVTIGTNSADRGTGGLEALEEIDPATRVQLDDAVERLTAGDDAGARDSLLDLQARWPEGPAAARAALLVAVIDLRRGEVEDAAHRLLELAGDETLEPALRHAAQVYYAAAQIAISPDMSARVQVLSALAMACDTTEPSPLVLPQDRGASMILLSEALAQRDDDAAALRALSWAFELGGEAERALALRRGAILSQTRLSAEELETCSASPDDFLKGLCGAARLLKLSQGDSDGPLSDEVHRALGRLDAGEVVETLSRTAMAPVAAPRVGAIFPLTGAARGVGARALGGVMVAEHVFGGRAPTLSTLVADSTSSPDGAAAAVVRLVDSGAQVIIGPLANGEAAAAAAAAEELGVPIVLLSFDASATELGPHVFRLFIDSDGELRALQDAARQRHVTRLAIAYPDRPFGRAMLARARHLSAARGIEVVAELGYDPGSRDYSNLARRLRRSKAEAVFIPDTGARASMIAPFLAAEGLWCGDTARDEPSGPSAERRVILCLGGSTWDGPSLFRDGGTYLDGALIAASYAAAFDTRANRRFVRDHKKLIGSQPDLFSAYAFEAMLLAHRSLAGHGVRQGIEAALRVPGEGLGGRRHTDEHGNILGEPRLLKLEGNALIEVPRSPPGM